MRDVIKENAPSTHMTQMAYIILPALADEMCEEMIGLDEMTIRVIMAQIGEIIAWIGHGDNARLPDSLRGFAEGIQPSIPEASAGDAGGTGRDELPADNDDEPVEAEIVD